MKATGVPRCFQSEAAGAVVAARPSGMEFLRSTTPGTGQELARLAILAKQVEATSGIPEIASSVGYKLRAVIRTRVGQLLKRGD